MTTHNLRLKKIPMRHHHTTEDFRKPTGQIGWFKTIFLKKNWDENISALFNPGIDILSTADITE